MKPSFVRLSLASVLVFVAALAMAACTSEPAAGNQAASPAADDEDVGTHAEQALLEDLTVANRILGRELEILDIQGHTSVRSKVDPNHWYMPRFVSPGGASVGDMIEYDLDSNEVHGPRTDNAREIFLHGEIYKARPDVMAVVHAHTPEFVAFGMSSVPMWNGDSRLPVWDIRPFNGNRSGVVSTPALGKAMAEGMGKAEAVLLWGHGIAVGATSLADAVRRVDELRDSAQMQLATATMGGTWKAQPLPPAVEGASQRMWEHYRRVVLNDTGGRLPVSPEPTPEKPSDPDQASAHDVVLANRILADQLGILDELGHVSLRNPRNPNSYFIAAGATPASATRDAVIQRDITTAQPDSQGLSIHDEIYKAHPEVNAVLYARTPEIVAFTTGGPQLRPVVNGGAFIGNGLPVVTVANLTDPAAGRDVATALTRTGAVLLAGRAYVLTSGSIYQLVDRAYQLRQNAIIQGQTLALRGKVSLLNERTPDPVPANQSPQPQQAGPTGPPEGRSWIFWSQNASLQ